MRQRRNPLLRTLVEKGAAIPAAFNQLNVDGTAWHIGDHEEYLAQILPEEGRDLPAGSLSGIIPGDGGLHLFKIWQRKETPPPVEEVSSAVISHLMTDITVELPE